MLQSVVIEVMNTKFSPTHVAGLKNLGVYNYSTGPAVHWCQECCGPELCHFQYEKKEVIDSSFLKHAQ